MGVREEDTVVMKKQYLKIPASVIWSTIYNNTGPGAT